MQSAKHAKLAARKRLTAEQAAGFIQTGLWRYSRHPNFWAEQCIWWSMYLFGVAATGAPAAGGAKAGCGRLAGMAPACRPAGLPAHSGT